MIDMKNSFKIIFVEMVLVAFLFSCAGGVGEEESSESFQTNMEDSYGYAGDKLADDYKMNQDYIHGSEKIAVQASTDSSGVASETVDKKTKIDRMLIKTATLSFEVNDLSSTSQKVETAIDKFNAYVGGMSQEDSYGRTTVSYEIKVPNESFEPLVALICSGVNEFETKQIDVADVTEEFIDVQARIKTKKDLEDQYSSLLDKAKTISEILEIESHLAAVRTEIESAEGRLKYLKSNVKYSTIYLDYYQEDPEVVMESGYDIDFANSFSDGWNSFVMFFVGLTRLWPFLIILFALLAYFFARIRRKRALTT